MELRHLRYFVAVGEVLSFTKAAEKLRLAQPSLTRQVRNLEDEIGVRLLDRANNRVALTEEGRRFLFDAKKLLAMCAESVAAVQRMSHGESAHLNIGYVANIHHGMLPATLGAFRKLCPEVALNLFDMGSAAQFEALDAHKIDLGFVGLPPSLSGSDLLCECVPRDTILVFLPARHPLAKSAKIKLAELAPQFFVGMSPKMYPGKREWLIATCRDAGFAARILQEVDSEIMAIKFVADGLGIALLPEQISSLPHEGVVFRPLSPPLRRESTIAWRADNPSKPLKDFIQIVKDLSRSMWLWVRSNEWNRRAPETERARHSLLNLLLRSVFLAEMRDWIFLLADVLALATISSVLVWRSGRPLAALSWILALLAVPFGSVIAWWLLGRTHL